MFAERAGHDRGMQTVLKLAGVLALGYALIVGLVFLIQDRLIYLPTERHVATPDRIGLAYEDVHLEVEQGVRVHGWFLPGPADDAPVLLFLHGNAGNVSHRLESLRIFHRLGLAVLIIDYRGYGLSTGRPDEEGLYADARAAWNYLLEQRGYAAGQVVLFGRSLGAALAARLAAGAEPGAVILESAFTSGVDLGAEVYPWLPVRLLLRDEYDIRGRVGGIDAPLLLAHSREDEIVSFAHAERLLEAAPEASLLEMRGGHNDGFLVTGRDYVHGLRDFLQGSGLTVPAQAPPSSEADDRE